MFWIERGDWKLALVLFVIGNVGVAGSIVFYESLLPHLVSEKELDRVSSAGYAIGYLGGGVLLAINLLMIQKPDWFGIPDAGTATRLALASVAVWWVVFSIPLFRQRARARRPHRAPTNVPAATRSLAGASGWSRPFTSCAATARRSCCCSAFLLYNDGIQTMIRMATIYGTEIGLPESAMITALLLTQFIGVPCAFVFGMVARAHRRQDGGVRRAGRLRC